MKIVDANVLLYASNTSSRQHVAANSWLTGALTGNETIGFPWVSLLAFIRLAALAVEHRAEIVTFDRDFERFAIRIHVPK